jgi:hypothetical protein
MMLARIMATSQIDLEPAIGNEALQRAREARRSSA